MIYSHNSSTGSTCCAKEASYCMFSLLKTCPNITANIADSILTMVTDALASFYVILPLSMDGRSSIIITKAAILRSTFKLFKHLSTPLITKKKVLNQLSRKPFAIGKTESSTLSSKPYHSDSHERTSNHNFYNQTKSTNTDNHSTSKSDKPVFIPVCHNCRIKGHKSPECPQAST